MKTPEEDQWLFTEEEIKESPSRVQDLPEKVEARLLAKSARYIQECSRELGVPQLTVFVAVKFFQRFFMVESMVAHHPPLVAATCLHLACKVQETIKRLRDVIYWTVKVRTRNTKEYPKGMEMTERSSGYSAEKDKILDKERTVLRALNFDLNVDQPARYLAHIIQAYIPNGAERRSINLAAWKFLNDCNQTYVHVRYDPREIATAVMFLSAKLHGYTLQDGTKRDPSTKKRLLAWYEFFRVDINRVKDICNMLLDLYDDIEENSSGAAVVGNGANVVGSLPASEPPTKRRRFKEDDKA